MNPNQVRYNRMMQDAELVTIRAYSYSQLSTAGQIMKVRLLHVASNMRNIAWQFMLANPETVNRYLGHKNYR